MFIKEVRGNKSTDSKSVTYKTHEYFRHEILYLNFIINGRSYLSRLNLFQEFVWSALIVMIIVLKL